MYHNPVLLSECVDGLNINPDGIYEGSLTINFKNDEEFERLLDFINKGN